VKPVVFAAPGNDAFLHALASSLELDAGRLEVRRFPDDESYVRIDTPVADRPVAIVCTLARPDPQFLPLWYAARTLRELGAARVGLVAPYLAYMRQDREFRPGEAVSSRLFAGLLSSAFDWLVTADPHLHRYRALDELYPIASRVVRTAPALAGWIRTNVRDPIVIGPDAESEQWVAAVAREAGAPHLVLEKTRRGDREVEIRLPDPGAVRDRTPVLVDDIVSTGQTIAEVARRLLSAGSAAPVCVAVHALFAEGAHAELVRAGVGRIVTTDTVAHATNAIPVAALFATPVRQLIGRPGTLSPEGRT
jgi:ribose-phosphate pyrophosphokinase